MKMKLEEITKLPLYVVYNELNIALQKYNEYKISRGSIMSYLG